MKEIKPEDIWNDEKSKQIEDFINKHRELKKQKIIQDMVDQEEKDIERFVNFAKTLKK